MRVGLIAVDSKYPNLALMKISAYHYRSCDFADYSPRKGFVCREYFNLLR